MSYDTNECQYVYIANSMLHRSKGDRVQQNKLHEKKLYSEWRVFTLLLTFFASYSLVSPLFYFDIRLQSHTTRAYFLTHSLMQSLTHNMAMSILFPPSTHSIIHSLELFANVAISVSLTHSLIRFHSGAVASHRVYVRTYVRIYT